MLAFVVIGEGETAGSSPENAMNVASPHDSIASAP
jgi:hypothetical protein